MSEITSAEITKYLPDKYKEMKIAAYKTIDSTNRVAKDLALAGHALPLLVVADGQTAGRGRLGRSFYSPSSTGVYMSLAVGGFDTPKDAVFITSAASVAVTDAIIALTGKSPGIKWVNDIYLDGRKICGILAESQKTQDGYSIIVGIGLNMTTSHFPEDISDIAGALNSDVPKEQMIAAITENLLDICSNPFDGSFIEKYKSRSVVLGKEISFIMGGMQKSGKAIDITDGGALIVETQNGDKIILSSGEITIRLK